MDLTKYFESKILDSYDDLTKARIIYYELSKFFEFDTSVKDNSNFLYYYKKYFKKYDIKNITNYKITCMNFSKIYVELLKLYNIKAYVESFIGYHAWVVIFIDNKLIYADMIYGAFSDLARFKIGLNSFNFSLYNKERIGNKLKIYNKDFENRILKIDESTYIKEELSFKYENIMDFKKRVLEKSSEKDKVKYIFEKFDYSSFGYYEGKEIIKYIFDICNINISNLKHITLNKNSLNGDVYTIRVYEYLGDFYLYFPHKGVYSVCEGEINILSKCGYKYYCGDKMNFDFESFEVNNFGKKKLVKIKKENLFNEYYSFMYDYLK